MTISLPTDRRLTDSEILVGIAEAILRDRFNPGSDLPFQPGEFLHRVGMDPRRLPPEFHASNPHRELEFRVAAQCWRLVGLGCLVPSVSSGWGVFHATEVGRKYLEDFDPAAMTTNGLDSRLAVLGLQAEDPPRFYARHAQDCFLAGHYEASIVMLGVAAESLIDQLVDVLDAANVKYTLGLRKRQPRPTARENLEWSIDALTNGRALVLRQLRAASVDVAWVDQLGAVLPGTGQAIRLARNQYGHPTGLIAGQEDTCS